MDRLRSFADGTPLYARVGRVLRQRIADGHWKIGEQIPTIEFFMAEFGVARATIREAIQQLVSDGVLESQRGRGTTVLGKPDAGRSINSPIGSDANVSIDLVEIDRDAEVPASLAGDLKLEPRYMRVRKVHRRNGAPVTTAEIFVAESFARDLSDESLRTTMLVTLLWDKISVDGIELEHRLTIGAADLGIVERLDCALGDPIVRIDRKCVDRRTGVLLYAAAAAYPGRSYELRFAGDVRNFAWLDASVETIRGPGAGPAPGSKRRTKTKSRQ